MISYNDQLKILQNILAQSPEGLSDPNLIGKFAKAKAFLHAQQSMEAMKNSPMVTPQAPQPTQMGQPDQSTTNEPLGATGLPNQPQTGKYDNL